MSTGPEQGSDARDGGYSLAEVLVSMTLFSALGTLLLALALNAGDTTDTITTQGDLTGESRVAIERMTRELREARTIESVQLPTSADPTTSITFWADFDGDLAKDTTAGDPEVLTYTWDPSREVLTLSSQLTGDLPILAARVTRFDLQLGSSLWEHQGAASTPAPASASSTASSAPTAPPAVTSWLDLDAAGEPVGNGNGIPDDELPFIDLVTLRLTVVDGGQSQTYDFRANLRNQDQS